MASKQIPCATEQGICKRVSGNFFRGTGNLIEGTLTREQPKPAEPQYQGAVTINGFISPAYRGVFSTAATRSRRTCLASRRRKRGRVLQASSQAPKSVVDFTDFDESDTGPEGNIARFEEAA